MRLIGFVLSATLLTLSACDFDSDIGKPSFAVEEKITFETLRQQDPQAELGAREHPRILETYGGVYESEKMNVLLVSILGRLVTHLPTDAPVFSITVLDSPTVNAFALPGGYLYITRGLLALANDESEIAAVITHEIAHVSKNHGLERNRQAQTVTIVERVVNEVVSNELARKVARATAQQKLAVFSQAQELQADKEGIDILAKAGFDPFAAARFLESMERFAKWRAAFGSAGFERDNFHPSTPHRISLAHNHAEKYSVGDTSVVDTSVVDTNDTSVADIKEEFLDQLDGLLFGDKENEGVIRKGRFSHSGLNITFSVPEPFRLFNRDNSIVAIGKNEEALRFDAIPIPEYSTSPEDYVKSGWVKGLLDESIVREKINFFKAATAQSLAGDWQFGISVVEVDHQYFRFVLAAPADNTDISTTLSTIVHTFRAMSEYERLNLKPLKLHIHKITAEDTLTDVLKPMVDLHESTQLFKALNGFAAQQAPKTGDIVKIVAP